MKSMIILSVCSFFLLVFFAYLSLKPSIKEKWVHPYSQSRDIRLWLNWFRMLVLFGVAVGSSLSHETLMKAVMAFYFAYAGWWYFQLSNKKEMKVLFRWDNVSSDSPPPKTWGLFHYKAKGDVIFTKDRVYLSQWRSFSLVSNWLDNSVLSSITIHGSWLVIRYHFASLPFKVVLIPIPQSNRKEAVKIATRNLRQPIEE